MTNEQINTAIARKLGIPLSEPCWGFSYWPKDQKSDASVSAGGFHTEDAARKDIAFIKQRFGFECSEPESYESPLEPPDYCSDLNLCHEAEKELTDAEGGEYDMHLWLQINSDGSRPASWHATPKQRALALCKTWGLGE